MKGRFKATEGLREYQVGKNRHFLQNVIGHDFSQIQICRSNKVILRPLHTAKVSQFPVSQCFRSHYEFLREQSAN